MPSVSGYDYSLRTKKIKHLYVEGEMDSSSIQRRLDDVGGAEHEDKQ